VRSLGAGSIISFDPQLLLAWAGNLTAELNVVHCHRHWPCDTPAATTRYGVATISRLLEIIGLFCKRALKKRLYSAKETYNFKEPTNRSHPTYDPDVSTHFLKPPQKPRLGQKNTQGLDNHVDKGW